MKTLFICMIFLFFLSSCGLQKFDRPDDTDLDSDPGKDDISVKDEDVSIPDEDSPVQDVDINETEQDEDVAPDEDFPCGSVYFNGTDSYISIEHNEALDLGITWTIEAWVMQDDISQSLPIIKKGSTTDFPSYYIYGAKADTAPYGGYFYEKEKTGFKTLYSVTETKHGFWYHIALEKNEKYLTIYIDGKTAERIESPQNALNNSQNIIIGASLKDISKYYFSGLIDEIRLSDVARYNKTGFVPEKRFLKDAHTVAVWHFEETSGTLIKNDGFVSLTGIIEGSVNHVSNCAEKSSSCDEQCFLQENTSCSNGMLSTCTKNSDGCFHYSNEVPCPTGICINDKTCGVDECPFEGITDCQNEEIRICVFKETGLLGWSEPRHCNVQCNDEFSCLGCSDSCKLGSSECTDGKRRFCVSSMCSMWTSYSNCILGECADQYNCKSNGLIDFSAGTDGSGCLIRSSGALYCWGQRLGMDNNPQTSRVPVRIDNRNDWQVISWGIDDTCGIANGELYCWGRTPVRIGEKNHWTSISNGEKHYCGIESGNLYCWGLNNYGQVGTGTTDDFYEPVKIGERNDWTDVSTGTVHSCGIAGGELLCWGYNNSGQVGDGTYDNRYEPVKIGERNDWYSISSGRSYSCGIAGGELFCWGENYKGLIGDDTVTETKINTPLKIGARIDWEKVESEGFSNCAIASGELFCWGINTYGQLGDGSTENRKKPVRTGTDSNWKKLSLGTNYSCAQADDDLFCWGTNPLIFYNNYNPSTPQKIGKINTWEKISAGNHICGISEGDIFCWGSINNNGELGTGDTNPVAVEKRITFNGGWTDISVAETSSCGINNSERYCKEGSRPGFFTKSDDKTGWKSIVMGITHSCGIINDDLFCWGKNNYGQLGNGTVNDSSLKDPIIINGKNIWQEVSIGESYTCGIIENELYCWGRNNFGQLGDGSLEDKLNPQKIGQRNDWKKIYASSNSTCGIANGELFCWGHIMHSNHSQPLKISTYTDWDDFAMRDGILCGIRKGGYLYCLREFQIDNNESEFMLPEKIGEEGFKKIFKSILLIKNDGTLYKIGHTDKHTFENGLILTPAPINNP